MRSGLGLRFVRELEQGKETVRMDKVNVALAMFNAQAVAGILEETDEGYSFKYDTDYLQSENASAVSLTLPLQEEGFVA